MIEDQRIVELAEAAGLCLPRCWDLHNNWESGSEPGALLKMRQLREFVQLLSRELVDSKPEAQWDSVS